MNYINYLFYGLSDSGLTPKVTGAQFKALV